MPVVSLKAFGRVLADGKEQLPMMIEWCLMLENNTGNSMHSTVQSDCSMLSVEKRD